MKVLTDTRLLFWRKMKETLRNPIYMLSSLLTPIIYLVLFAPLLKNLVGVPGLNTSDVLNVFVPGLLVIIAFFAGLFVGFNMIDEVRNGVVERLRVTPTSRFALLAGRVLRDMVNMLFIVTVFVVISVPFGFKPDWAGFLLFVPLLCLLLVTTSSFGNALGLLLRDEDRLAPLVQGINLPVLLLSGVLLPMELAPSWLQDLAHLNPAYYVVEAGRLLVAGHIHDAKVAVAYLVMVPLTIITVWWATRAFRQAIS
jgi:ABC-2 type transport system permease protein